MSPDDVVAAADGQLALKSGTAEGDAVTFATNMETDPSGGTSRAADGAVGSVAAFTGSVGAALVGAIIVIAAVGSCACCGAKTNGATCVKLTGTASRETDVDGSAGAEFAAKSLDATAEGVAENVFRTLPIMRDCTFGAATRATAGAAASATAAQAVAVPSPRKFVTGFNGASKRWRCSS